MITDKQIADGCNKAYLKAGHNAYFGNGFEAGVKFALEQVKKLSSNTVLADSTPSQECYKSGEPCKYDCSGLCKESC